MNEAAPVRGQPLSRSSQLLIFCAAFVAYAYFHQGGGWNQNARFAMVRAMAEEHVFDIDDFLVYSRDKSDPVLIREHVRNGDFSGSEGPRRLAWTGARWDLHPVNGVEPEDGRKELSLEITAASGDVGFFNGHFHPNKPPGSAFLALPGYALIHGIERAAGVNPDNWWVLTCNEWLTSVFSAGLVSALGCVLFFRSASMLAPGQPRAALAAALAFAFGTMFFPYATLLFDQNLTATALLGAFYLILRARRGLAGPPAVWAAGLLAGIAAITNYIAAPAVAMLGIYLLARDSGPPRENAGLRSLATFALGVAGPFALICAYGQICFHTPFALNTNFQDPLFKVQSGGFLGMFALPNPYVGLVLLVSPYRGIFYTSPVLLLGVYGWLRLPKALSAEKWLFAFVFGLFFLVNTCFNGYHGGFCSEPRYLGPAVPFLALPMVFGFMRFPKISFLLTVLSIFIQLLITAVDVESPVGVGSLAMIDSRPDWEYSPLTEYTLPIFWSGHAWPILNRLVDEYLKSGEDSPDSGESNAELSQRRSLLMDGIRRSEREPFLLATFRGPVSVNPVGAYEGSFYHLFQPFSVQTRWSSFNAGEFLFPESRLSLLPLLVVCGVLIFLSWRNV